MATNTYVALKTTTVTGSAVPSVTLDLTGVSGYTDIEIFCSALGTWSSNEYEGLNIRFNGDSSGNTKYSYQVLAGNGSAANAYRYSNQAEIQSRLNPSYLSNTAPGITKIYLQNYSNTTTYKPILIRNSQNTEYYKVQIISGQWRDLTQITSVTISASQANIAVGSTFTVYGIANADNFVKATGGIITEDATYTYHTFGSSGTFTPKQALTADILVIAGGGGAGDGGGGAGGVATYSSQSLTTTGYTVTVGAGGVGGKNATSASTVGGNSQFGALTAANGGGRGQTPNLGAYSLAGGSGAGSIDQAVSGGTGSQGSNGGKGYTDYASYDMGGGGGGYSVAGGDATAGLSGTGGNGISTYSSWGLATGTGQNVSGTYWYAGGGSGGGGKPGFTGIGAAGYGGGGLGWYQGSGSGAPTAGTANTGGGGGGGTGTNFAGAGGSGIVIVRYAK